MAAPASVPHSPDAQLLGGIAASLKPGLAAGLLSGWGQGSSQGLHSHTAFLPRCCQAELRHCACSASPGWGEQCHLLFNFCPLVFHSPKPGRTLSRPTPSQLHGQHSFLQACCARSAGNCSSGGARAWAAQAQLERLSLAPGGASWARTTAGGSWDQRDAVWCAQLPPPPPGAELHNTSLKTFIVSNNKSQPCGSTGSPERAGCWHSGLAAPSSPLPVFLGSSRAGRARGDG